MTGYTNVQTNKDGDPDGGFLTMFSHTPDPCFLQFVGLLAGLYLAAFQGLYEVQEILLSLKCLTWGLTFDENCMECRFWMELGTAIRSLWILPLFDNGNMAFVGVVSAGLPKT